MTRNPYADPVGYEPEPGPSRVSALAVASLVFGLLCCIPGVGFIALLVGVAAMVAISRSDGRLAGRGLATAGLVLGLLGIIWTGLLGFVVLQGTAQVQSLSGTYAFVEQRDYPGFRNSLTPAASQQLSDEQIADFQQRVNQAWGKHQGATRGLGQLISGYQDVMPHMQQFQTLQRPGQTIMPVPIKFENGTALAIIELDTSQSTSRGQPGIENMMILDPSGKPIWLIPPAAGAAPAPGTPPPPAPPPVEPGETGEQPEPPPAEPDPS